MNALRANWAETTLALFGLAGIVAGLTKAGQLSGPLLAALLLFPTLGMAAAPYNSWAARRAALPARLRDRRRTEYRRDRRTFAAGIATGGAVAVAGVAALPIALLLGGHHVTARPGRPRARHPGDHRAVHPVPELEHLHQHPDPDPHVRDAQHNPLDVHHADPIPVDVGDHDPVSHPLCLDNHNRPVSPQNRITGVSPAPGPIFSTSARRTHPAGPRPPCVPPRWCSAWRTATPRRAGLRSRRKATGCRWSCW